MNMIRLAMGIVLGTLCLHGVETTWIGNATGNWADVSNWDGGVPTATTTAVIELDGDRTITLTGTTRLQHLRVTGTGTLTLVHSGNGLYFGKDDDGTCGVEVDADAVVVADTTFQAQDTTSRPRFVKSGAGELRIGTTSTNRTFGKNGYQFAGVEVGAGTLVFACKNSGDYVDPGRPATINIRRGARFDVRGPNTLVNWGCYDVDEGGILDLHGMSDFIGGFRGAGTVTNLNGNINCSLRDGPYTFTGRFYGSGEGSITPQPWQFIASSNSTTTAQASADEAHLIVGPEALANLGKIIISTNCLPWAKLIQFAPGYPADTVFNVKRIESPRAWELWLEDPAGNPVTVRSNFAFDGDWTNVRPIRGCGNLVQIKGALVATNGCLANTGFVEIESGSLQLGSFNDPLQDANPPASEYRLGKSGSLLCANVTPEPLRRVTGSGTLTLTSPLAATSNETPWILEDLSLTNGTINVSGTRPYPHYQINGGVSTNVTIGNYGSATGLVLIVTGGDLHISGGSIAGQRCEIRQSGGHVSTDTPLTGWYYTSGCTNDVFFRATGGVFESRTQNTYGRGLGADLSGTAYLKLRNGVGGFGAHRISSDGYSHSLTLSDDAVLDVDHLQIASNTERENPNYYAHLNLNGGTLLVQDDIVTLGYTEKYFPHGLDGRILFNGTQIRAFTLSDSVWFNDRTTLAGYIGAGGLKMETAKESLEQHVRFIMPLYHDPDCAGRDGGLVKSGRGSFVTQGAATYNGFTRVLGGRLREDGTLKTGAPFGTNSVELVNGYISAGGKASLEFAGGDGATISFDGTSAVGCYEASGALLCGPFVRRNHGVLLLEGRNAATTLGSAFTLKLTEAPTLRADTLPELPVFSYIPASGFYGRFGFVTYDATTGFVPAATVDDFTGGEQSLVMITNTVRTLTADAHVAGVDLSYRNGNVGEGGLVIGTGRTLTIGSGAGYAPLLLNGTTGNSDKPGQSVTGGTIDFGTAEGLILVAQSQYYGWYRASKIKSVLTGTGGLTFAGGLVGDRHMDVELSQANTWTGGTVIESCTVKPMVAGALSTGAVTVQGNAAMGGTIWVESGSAVTTIPNALTLAGRGCYSYQRGVNYIREADFGALCVDRSVTVTGAVTLADDARVSARGSAVLAFTGGIAGAGALNVAGGGTVRLGTGNTYAGGTVIEGVAECAAADALGTGPVEIAAGGVLRFTNTASLTFTNDVAGAGRIVFAGTAPVTFTGKNDFTGSVHGEGALTGAGVSFVKNTSDVTTLTGANTYGGATEVNAGTLVLGLEPVAETVPFAADVTAHVDASAPGAVLSQEVDGTTFVTNVVDADGRAIVWANQTADAMPQLRSAAMNGRDTFYFDGKIDRLVSTKGVRTRTVFAVFRTPAGSHPSSWGCAGFFGQAGCDAGIRLGGTRTFQTDCWLKFANVWLNGARATAYPADVPVVGSFEMAVDVNAVTALGNYWGSSTYSGRTWWGEIAEVICYNRLFADDERVAVERYLAEKWGATLPETKRENVLPENSAVTVAAGATIDLAGSDQTFTSLAGAGALVNSSATNATVTLRAGALDAFAGSIAGDAVTLRIAASLTLDPSRIAVAPTVDLVLESGANLDLNGGTLTVRNVSGTGWVRNGTLIVTGEDNRRNPATVIILR